MCELAATCVHVPGEEIAGSQAIVTRFLEQSAMSRDGYQSYAQTRGARSIVGMHDRDSGEE